MNTFTTIEVSCLELLLLASLGVVGECTSLECVAGFLCTYFGYRDPLQSLHPGHDPLLLSCSLGRFSNQQLYCTVCLLRGVQPPDSPWATSPGNWVSFVSSWSAEVFLPAVGCVMRWPLVLSFMWSWLRSGEVCTTYGRTSYLFFQGFSELKKPPLFFFLLEINKNCCPHDHVFTLGLLPSGLTFLGVCACYKVGL